MKSMRSEKASQLKSSMVIGGSGSGKTRFYVKPNLMQMHSSYCVTDPKGTILVECGKMLVRNGYAVKSLNTINFAKSLHYNPFAYIHSEKDILKLVNTIIVNTKGEGDKSGEDFWVKAEKLYYTALIGYIWYEAPDNEKNFTTLLEMINASEAREDDETFKNPVDKMFDELEAEEPEHFAVKQYRKYKLAAGKTAKSILISCGARLAPFDIAELRELMSYDELELDTLGERKSALFVIISDTDDTFNFVAAIMDSNIAVNLHIKTLDQAQAIKQIKSKITDLDKMKIEEQKKAVRSGYDMDGQIGREDTPQKYVARLTDVFTEVRRVLRQDGTLFLNISDTYAGKGNQGENLDPKYPNGRTGQTVAINRTVEGCKSKDMIGIPWMLAFALRDAGWYLRNDIIWMKQNPMSCLFR